MEEDISNPIDAVAPEAIAQDAQQIALGLWDRVLEFFEGLMRPWNAYQVAIVIGLILGAHLLTKVLGPALHNWMRTREGWPKWRMRILVMAHRRLRLIFFVLLSWPTYWIMQEVTLSLIHI